MELFLNIVPVLLLVLTAGLLSAHNQDFGFTKAFYLLIGGFILYVLLGEIDLPQPSLIPIIFGVIMFLILLTWAKFSFPYTLAILALWVLCILFVEPYARDGLAQATDYFFHWAD